VATRADVKGLSLDGVAPDAPTYPIYAPIGLGYESERRAEVQPVIDWLLSEKGQGILNELGVITVQ
jgi:hypothetical protein